ncbi:leucine-rich repeat protein [Robinsoniella peoriensis]|uniref:Outer membrane protein YopM n=1 Tax=Robinsoniella peoriensis TaxID=180332 RepID=A0A4U8QA38_9FIRM|nr:leucine-rich repeat protein [Robinsoniella peoriensis]MDU7029194.1 leucine-rich repeat protein [Clostridiales bacterium]TLD01841.1 Outer membrane protein YopM [Robinsoniella peoriensis]
MKRFKQSKRILSIIMAASIAVSSNIVVFANETGENPMPQTEAFTENQETGTVSVESETDTGNNDSEKPQMGLGMQETETEQETDNKEIITETQETEFVETEQVSGNNTEAVRKQAEEKSLNNQQKGSSDLNLSEWEYEQNDKMITLKKYKGKTENLVIPGQTIIQGQEYSVRIAKYTESKDYPYFNGAFSANYAIKTIRFLDGVSFEDNDMSYSFADCNNLESVSGIPDSVTKMESTFMFCSKLKKIDKLPANLKDMVRVFISCEALEESPGIPSGVTNLIGSFQGCESLKKGPELPQGITDISNIYEDCINLTEISRLPDSVRIMKGALKNCKSLNKIENLPVQLVDMGEAFSGCEKLVQVPDIPKGVTELDNTFSKCSSLKEMPKLPAGLKSLDGTFSECTSLVTSGSIPGGVTEMNGTFYGCASLTKAPKLPEGLKSIANLFFDCSKLEESPLIPDSVINMYGAFSYCQSLKRAPKLPSKLKNMGSAFSGCLKITKAPDIPETVENMAWAFTNCRNLKGSMTIYSPFEKDRINDDGESSHGPYTSCFDNTAEDSTGLTVNYGPKCKKIDNIIKEGAYHNKKVKKGQLVLQVKFKANGGTTEKSYKNVYYKKKYGKLPTPQRAKYSFSGWYTKKSGGTKITSSSKITGKKNITLYAHWKKVTVGKVSSVSLKNTKANRVTVNTKAVSGAKGYLITYARNSSFTKDKKALFTSYVNKNINKLQKNKNYFIKVRAYKLDSAGKKIYGKYSSVKKIKITK